MSNHYNIKAKNELEIIQSDKGDCIFKFTNKCLKLIKRGKIFQKNFVKDGKNSTMTFMHHDAYVNKVMPVMLKQQKDVKDKKDDEDKKANNSIYI